MTLRIYKEKCLKKIKQYLIKGLQNGRLKENI